MSLLRANVEIGANISRFAAGLARATRMTRRFMSRVARIVRAGLIPFRLMGNAIRSVTGVLRRFVSRLNPLRSRLFQLASAASAFFAIQQSVKTFANFEQRMARVQAVSGATAAQFEALSAKAQDMGRSTQFSASDAAEAMGNFAVAGFTVGEILNAISPTLNLAASGQLDMATSSDIVAKTMRGMGLDAEETTRAVDVMAKAFTTSNTDLVMLGDAFRFVGPIGKAAGKSLEELTATIQVMSNAGIQGGQAGRALRMMLLRMQAPPAAVSRQLDKLGVKVADSTGTMKPMAQIIDEVNAATADMTPVQRSAVAATLAGTRASAAFLALMAEGGDSLREFERRLEGSAGTAERIARIQMNTLQGAFIRLKSAVEGTMISFGRALKPAMEAVTVALTDMQGPLSQALEQIKPLSNAIGNLLVQGIRNFTDFLSKNIATFREWAVLTKEIILGSVRLIGALGDKIAQVFGLKNFTQGAVNAFTKILNILSLILENPKRGFGAIVSFIKGGLFKVGQVIVMGLEQAFAALIATLFALLKATMQTLFGFLREQSLILGSQIETAILNAISVGDAARNRKAEAFQAAAAKRADQELSLFGRRFQQAFGDARKFTLGVTDVFTGPIKRGAEAGAQRQFAKGAGLLALNFAERAARRTREEQATQRQLFGEFVRNKIPGMQALHDLAQKRFNLFEFGQDFFSNTIVPSIKNAITTGFQTGSNIVRGAISEAMKPPSAFFRRPVANAMAAAGAVGGAALAGLAGVAALSPFAGGGTPEGAAAAVGGAALGGIGGLAGVMGIGSAVKNAFKQVDQQGKPGNRNAGQVKDIKGFLSDIQRDLFKEDVYDKIRKSNERQEKNQEQANEHLANIERKVGGPAVFGV